MPARCSQSPCRRRRAVQAVHVRLQLLEDRSHALLAEADLQQGLEQFLGAGADLLVEAGLHRGGRSLRARFEQLLVASKQTANVLQRLADAVGVPLLVEIGILIVSVARDFGDANSCFAQLCSNVENFIDRDRRAQDGLQDPVLGVLDPACQGHLALAGEQSDRHHPAQVHPNGIVGVARLVRVFRGGGNLHRAPEQLQRVPLTLPLDFLPDLVQASSLNATL